MIGKRRKYASVAEAHEDRNRQRRARRDRIKGTPEYFRRLEIQRRHNENYRQYQAVKAARAAKAAKAIEIPRVVHPSVSLPLKGSLAMAMVWGLRRRVA